MVMGRDSHSKGRGFECRHCILDILFSHILTDSLKPVDGDIKKKLYMRLPPQMSFVAFVCCIGTRSLIRENSHTSEAEI